MVNILIEKFNSYLYLLEILLLITVLPTLLFFAVSFLHRLYRLVFCKNTVHAYVVKGVSLTWSIALYPLICLSKHGYALRDTDAKKYLVNHELIHIHQQHETYVIFGYLVYGIEYLVRLIVFRNRYKAYRSLSMEAEAYINQNNLQYLENRRRFAWVKYLFTKNL